MPGPERPRPAAPGVASGRPGPHRPGAHRPRRPQARGRKRAASPATPDGADGDAEDSDGDAHTDTGQLPFCGTGAVGPDGRPTFGEDWSAPVAPIRDWTAAPLDVEGVCNIDPDKFEAALAAHGNRALVEWVVDGLRHGFDTLVECEEAGPLRHANMPMDAAAEAHIDKEFAGEIGAGRYRVVAEDAHPHLRTQSMGAVPKKSLDPNVLEWRTIVNLSKGSRGVGSVNDSTQALVLKFIKMQAVCEDILRRGPQCRANVYDLRAAYRQLRKKSALAHWYGLRWRGVTVVDCNLEFGGRASPWVFASFSAALAWIVQRRLDETVGVGNTTVFCYLDDIGVVCQDAAVAEVAFPLVLQLWDDLGVVASPEKCLGNNSRCTWLGLLLDLQAQSVELPEDKAAAYAEQLEGLAAASSATRAELLQAAGRLGFANAAHPAARPFVSEFYRLAAGLTEDFHRVRLTNRAKQDALVWAAYLRHGPPAKMEAAQTPQACGVSWRCGAGEEDGIYIVGDASGGKDDGREHGFGWVAGEGSAVHGHSFRPWTPADRRDLGSGRGTTSSGYLETLAMAEAIATYASHVDVRGKTITYWADSTTVLANWHRGRSSNIIINDVLRRLALFLAQTQLRLVVRWASRWSPHGQIADALSHCPYPLPQRLLDIGSDGRNFHTPCSIPLMTAASLRASLTSLRTLWRPPR